MALILLLGITLLAAQLVPQEERFEVAEWQHHLADSALLRAADWLGLTSLARSTFLYTTFVLVILNLSLNLLERLRTLGHELRVECPLHRADKLAGRDIYRRLEVSGEPNEVLARTGRFLERQGFVVDGKRDGLLGVRRRTSVLGSLLFHASLIVLAAGGIVSTASRVHGVITLGETQAFDGRYEQYQILTPRDLPEDELPRVSFRLADVEVRYDDDDNVVDATATLETPDGVEVVRVNHPYRIGEAAIRFVDYSLAPVFVVRDPARGVERGAAVKLAVMPPGRTDSFRLPDIAAELEVAIYPDFVDAGGEPGTRGRDLRNPVAVVSIEGGRFTARVPRDPDFHSLGPYLVSMPEVFYWARLDLNRDAGRWVVYVALLLGVIGLGWRFGLPIQRVEALVDKDEAGGAVALHLAGRPDYTREPFASRFERLVDALGQELPG